MSRNPDPASRTGRLWTFLASTAMVIVLLACIAGFSFFSPEGPNSGADEISTGPTSPSPDDELAGIEKDPIAPSFHGGAVRDKLEHAGWSAAAAEAVVQLNTTFFEILREENPSGWETKLARLRRLGEYPGLTELLEKHPETAGLLAGAVHPEIVADTLHDVRNYDTVTKLYTWHAADPETLAVALREHKSVMIRLAEAGSPGTEAVFLYPHDGKAAQEYGDWLEELLRGALRGGEDELAAALGVVLSQGPAIRQRMEKDAEFRHQFRDEIWPQFERLIDRGHLTWEMAANHTHLFDVLAMEQGESLVEKWGLLPSYLLFGPNSYPKSLHPRIIEVMLSGDNATLGALVRFRDSQPAQFLDLLKRDISKDTLAAALNQLKAVRDVNVPAKLAYFGSLSNEVLAKEVGPPPSGPVTWIPLYDTLQVGKKVIQGRDVSGLEWGFAIVDPALMLIPGAKGLATAGKIALKKGLKKAAKETAEKQFTKVFVTKLGKNAGKQAAKEIGEQVAKNLGEKELKSWLFSQTMARLRQRTKDALQDKLTVEITGPVTYFFKATGFGRKNFKRLTSLEARLFMRNDAKVFVRLDRLAQRPLLKNLFAETTLTGGVDTALSTKAGQDAAAKVMTAIQETDDQNTAWRQNVSAWWFLNAADLPQRSE